jgi:hypothetical protein
MVRVRVTRGRAATVALLGTGAVATAIIALGGSGSGAGGAGASASAASTSTATTTVKRQDLVEVDTQDGTLGYADSRSVVNRLSGTVTWLPSIGSTRRADQALYDVDGEPVILMDGRLPAYRTLQAGVADGTDVLQLERGLHARGYDAARPIAVDGSWTAATTAAVKRWQVAHGLRQSGAVSLGRVVFEPGARRVSSKSVTLGGSTTGAGGGGGGSDGERSPSADDDAAAASNTLMTTTSLRRVVTVKLPTTKSALAKTGRRVTVTLPSGAGVHGRIRSVGKVATLPSGEDGGDATINVTIGLFTRRTGLDQAPVSVRFMQSRRKRVLAIPVTALLARPGGRFAVQVVQADGSRRTVAVQPGLYTSGYVEISGDGVRAGQRVTNAAVQ